MTRDTQRSGTLYVLTAYVVWGLLPIYWKALQSVPAPEILAHRIFWSFVFVSFLLWKQQRWAEFKWTFRSRSNLWICILTAAIIGSNWFIYIWAVIHDHIVDTSLGYFINPLITVLLGVIFLHEKLNRWQIIAFVLASLGVGYLTLEYGRVPWIALSLALTFGIYGLLRKTARIEALSGLTAETGLLSPLVLTYLLLLALKGESSAGSSPAAIHLLLLGSGLVTAGPLLWFTIGVRRIKLSTAGFLQYLAPSMQLLLGVVVYREPFTRTHLISFGLIWTALIIFSLSNTPLLNRPSLTSTSD
ncbi:MAG: EamA family transporter RarD [Candidatus Aminicenantaceae bacterium]